MKTIGVIGLGSIGMRHARNLESLGHKVRGYDPDMKRRLMLNGVLWSEEEVMDSDAIVIASPTIFHSDHIWNCIEHKKPFFIEKPVSDKGLTLWDHNYPLALMVGFNLRFLSCVKKAKEWLSLNSIGNPLWANFTLGQFNNKPAYLRDGVILNFASHEIDLSCHLLGRATVLCATTQIINGNEFMTDFVLQHEDGVRSSNHTDYLTKPEIRQSIIVGDAATIIIDIVNRHAWLRSEDGILDQFEGSDEWNDTYSEEMEAFIRRIDGKKTLGATMEDGLHVLELALRVKELSGL